MTALATNNTLAPMVAGMVDDKVNEMFRTAHRCAGSTSGDITPEMQFFLDAVAAALAGIITGQTLSNVEGQHEEGIKIFNEALSKMAEFMKPQVSADVLVIVKGGLVTGAWGSSDKVNIEIIDFDNEPGENFEDEDRRIEEEAKGMVAIY